MTFSKYREESRPIFVSLKLTNIYDLNMYFIAPFRYLYFHDKLLMFFKNYFKTNDNIHIYNTRSSSSIHITYKRTITMANFPSLIEELQYETA